MLVTSDTIEKYIPQRKPFVFVDSLIEATEGYSKSRYTIKKDAIFNIDGFFTEPGLIEHMAQSAALGVGYNFVSKNIPVPLGFIGAVKHFELFSLPKIGSTLETTITIENQVFNITIVKGLVVSEGINIATAELKIFIADEKG